MHTKISEKMMSIALSVIMLILCALKVTAKDVSETDTVVAKDLNEVVVKARNKKITPEVSTFFPTARQKDSSRDATDLLRRMAIPYITVSGDDAVKTVAQKDVAIFIDYMPATTGDIQGMKTSDVKKVEYYDFPADARFMGSQHVVNFIMAKYEYGGYFRGFATGNPLSSSGQLSAYSKVNYKSMTYDVSAGMFANHFSHVGTNSTETYRLPQNDGTIKEFNRVSETTYGKSSRQKYWPTFRALYSSDKISIRNQIGASFDFRPNNNSSGRVLFTPEVAPTSDFSTSENNHVNSLSYMGMWYFDIGHGNSILFTPTYKHSHTNTIREYKENGYDDIINGAKDDTHSFSGIASFSHAFNNWGVLKFLFHGSVAQSVTDYRGSVVSHDRSLTGRLAPKISYSLGKGKFYYDLSVGAAWDKSEYGDFTEKKWTPELSLSVQYSPNEMNKLAAEFEMKSWEPTASSKSTNVIQLNPLLSYTGNPELMPMYFYSGNLSYAWFPTQSFSLSVWGSVFLIKDRYAIEYEPSSTGILRKLVQPGGAYRDWGYGVNASWHPISSLQLSVWCLGTTLYDGGIFDYHKTSISGGIQAYYYIGHWYLGGNYASMNGSSDGTGNGVWITNKDSYNVLAGWYDKHWNISCAISNFCRWNWREGIGKMNSEFYSTRTQSIGPDSHFGIRLTAVYTFGFGKKIDRRDEVGTMSGAESGILK